MDAGNLALLLKQTLDPTTRESAEAELNKVHKIIGFCPGLLQVVMTNTVDSAVRQAGIIYFKNLVSSSWIAKDPPESNLAAITAGTAPPVNPDLTFTIHEQDRGLVRENIVKATVQAPEVIRIQLAVCVSMVIKHDFPHKWPQVVDQISIYLQTPETGGWPGALTCLHQLVKNYEYKKKEDRAPLNDAMNLLLPLIYDIMLRALPDQVNQCLFSRENVVLARLLYPLCSCCWIVAQIMVFEVPIGIRSTNWYSNYQLVLKLPIGTRSTN
jgi:hypothetical protein